MSVVVAGYAIATFALAPPTAAGVTFACIWSAIVAVPWARSVRRWRRAPVTWSCGLSDGRGLGLDEVADGRGVGLAASLAAGSPPAGDVQAATPPARL